MLSKTIDLNFFNPAKHIQKQPRKGFTLIELLIVIGVIGILMALAAYSFGNIRRKVRKTSCRENLRIIQQAAVLAQMENSNLSGKNLTVKTLFEMGYLKKLYKCPSGGSYAVTDESENLKVTCFKTTSGDDHGYVD